MQAVAYETLLAKEGHVITHVVGTSMLPLLHDRESIVLVESNLTPERGDVVLYKTQGTYILHRVLRVRENDYVIRGDNTWVLECIPKTQVLAVMTRFCRRPDGKMTDRHALWVRVYRLVLPCIRWARRIGNKVKREIRRRFGR